MNIFFVDPDPHIAAQMLCDKHVVKMTVETAQMLSTALGGPYKPTHRKHPSTLWAAEHIGWTLAHFYGLLDEYKYRYGKDHACSRLTFSVKQSADAPWVDPPQCMPDIYKQSDCVSAYRAYYKGDKARFAKWQKSRPAPLWFYE
jgi:hypothetical protein